MMTDDHDLCWFLVHFGDRLEVVWGSFWGQSGIILESIRDRFGIVFRIVLEYFWDSFGIVLG